MRHCIATIWPSWAPHWIRCGSLMRYGRCMQYGHADQGCEPSSGVVDGIRPHLPVTPEELAERERVMLSLPITPLDL